MKPIGKIISILNEQFLLVSSSELLSPDDIITVFKVIKDERISTLNGIGELIYPVGELRVRYAQSDEIYLVERFREIKQRTRTVGGPIFNQTRDLAYTLSNLAGETITEDVPGPWSINFAGKENLNIDIPQTVQVGDTIASENHE